MVRTQLSTVELFHQQIWKRLLPTHVKNLLDNRQSSSDQWQYTAVTKIQKPGIYINPHTGTPHTL